jgi:hypothetical protein
MSDVKVNQVWADNDPRCPNRYLRVLRIENGKALVETVQRARTATGWRPGPVTRLTRIRIDRFKPTRTGYRLVEDA